MCQVILTTHLQKYLTLLLDVHIWFSAPLLVPPILPLVLHFTHIKIEKCALWNESSMMSSIMWEGENARLMLEIGKQSFILPLQFYPKTIRKALNMFRNTLMNVPKMKFFGNRIQTYWQVSTVGQEKKK
jgi:hypothetical protein